ncbi:MAG: alpha/beta hydrolase [Ruminococcus sp.]|uniref:alpha/beta hydrolase n=1 Tax=Ruminococcus sp. TaxID=41978 RepID=UPI0025CD8798|nr:alpha/beta hydrolase-fold protein [Ruminococcus sp.]MBR5683807.1 alpha/beta hydrolase [Ruminococcus sp.]
MKKITAAVLSLAFLLCLASCSSSGSEKGSNASSLSQKVPAETKLTNHMSDTERSRLTVGQLTVFDHEQKEDGVVPSEGIYLELWNGEDYADYYEHYNEHNSDYPMTDEEIKEAVEYTRGAEGDIKYAFVDGDVVVDTLDMLEKDYDGGEITLYELSPVLRRLDENGNEEYYDRDNNKLTEEEANEMEKEFFSEEHKRTFADFEELKPYLHDVIKFTHMGLNIPTAETEHDYEQILRVWEAVIDKSYKTVPYGTVDKWIENRLNPSADSFVWEIDHDKIKAIEPYVREYNIYDEQLDTNFVVHVTLPPDFSGDRTYPAYVLTDGVWRFNDCAELRKTMEEGKADDVLLVSIGYDYGINGMDDENRIKFFCDRCEDFLTLITDDLMPYLGEEYSINYEDSTLFGHSLGGTFAHYAVFNSDKYENQPFGNYIIGSPAFWSPGFLPYTDGDEFRREYGYFDRNKSIDKRIFVCGGADEDPVYDAYYGENDSTLQGIEHLMERLEAYGVTTAESKIYPDSEHYQFIPGMLVEMLEKFYPKN